MAYGTDYGTFAVYCMIPDVDPWNEMGETGENCEMTFKGQITFGSHIRYHFKIVQILHLSEYSSFQFDQLVMSSEYTYR